MRLNRILIGTASVLTIFGFSPTTVLAQNTSATPGAQTTRKTQTQAQRMTQIKERAKKEIDRRLATLSTLNSKIASSPKMTTEDKSQLTTLVNQITSDLATLRLKIEADTDPAVLKIDVQSVVRDYRVYALIVPKVHILNAADRLMNTAEKVASIAAKLSDQIDILQSNAQDTTVLRAQLDQIEMRVEDAKAKAKSAHDQVIVLTPAGYPDNKTVMEAAKNSLKSGKEDLVFASKEARKIAARLGIIRPKLKSASPPGLTR